MQQRDSLIDLLKGIAIVLVVIGHATQWFSNFDNSNPLFVIIYSFHMPLFMFLSGYVSYNKKGKVDIKKRFYSLVIPFFIWFLLSFALYRGYFSPFHLYKNVKKMFFEPLLFVNELRNLFFDPTIGRWFLWILFWLCILLYFALKINKNREEITLAVFLVTLTSLYVLLQTPLPYFGLPELCWYLFFFTFGYIFHKYKQKMLPYIKTGGQISLFVFPVLILLTQTSGKPSFLDDFSGVSVPFRQAVYGVHLYLSALSGVLAIYLIINHMNNYAFFLKKQFLFLGTISLEVYVTHYYFGFLVYLLKDYINSLYINILIFSTLSIIGSSVTQFYLKKIKVLSKLLYGR